MPRRRSCTLRCRAVPSGVADLAAAIEVRAVPPPSLAAQASGGDHPLLALLSSTDADLARLGLLRDRNIEPQYAVAVAGLHLVEVEVVPQDQLAAEYTPWTLARHQFVGRLDHGP